MRLLEAFDTPWKISNELERLLISPLARLRFAFNGIRWGRDWRFYGLPLLLKHRQSEMTFGDHLSLRSTLTSNPLGPLHAVILCTWQAGAVLAIGDNFGMTGGTICTAGKIVIGSDVIVGANTTIVDTDFHPLNPGTRGEQPQAGLNAPIRIEDEVFIGMNCLILKGVCIGRGSMVGAGSIVTRDVPAGAIAAGNPARVIGQVEPVSKKQTGI